MERIPNNKYSEAIERAFRPIPQGIRDLIKVDFLCGTDSIFAGLETDELTGDGRSYRITAHYCPNDAQCLPVYLRKPTIVLPVLETPETIVHELGHALDNVLGEREEGVYYTDLHQIPKFASWVDDDAETFAEAFLSYLAINEYGDESKIQELFSFFNSLWD